MGPDHLQSLLAVLSHPVPDQTAAQSEIDNWLERIRRLCTEYTAASLPEQEQIRELIRTRSVGRSLLSFAYSAAVFAIRNSDTRLLRDGVLALAINDNSTDYRDVTVALTMLFHSADKLSVPHADLTEDALSHASGAWASFLSDFARRHPADRTIECMGFREGETDGKFNYIYIDDLWDDSAGGGVN